MTSLMIEQFTCRQDNFGVILHDPLTGETASIDAPDGSKIADRLGQGFVQRFGFLLRKVRSHREY